MDISELNLSVRSYNLLKRKGILEVEILLLMTDDEIISLYDRQKATGEICEAVKLLRAVGAEHYKEHWSSWRKRLHED